MQSRDEHSDSWNDYLRESATMFAIIIKQTVEGPSARDQHSVATEGTDILGLQWLNLFVLFCLPRPSYNTSLLVQYMLWVMAEHRAHPQEPHDLTSASPSTPHGHDYCPFQQHAWMGPAGHWHESSADRLDVECPKA
eukprot:2708317-Amphidinium_carterae.1